MPKLTYQKFRGGVATHKLSGSEVTIGRSKGSTLPFPQDNEMSREHAMIRMLPDRQYVVKDLESKNGTYVNDAPISTWVLRDGDRIRIGTALLTFHL